MEYAIHFPPESGSQRFEIMGFEIRSTPSPLNPGFERLIKSQMSVRQEQNCSGIRHHLSSLKNHGDKLHIVIMLPFQLLKDIVFKGLVVVDDLALDLDH